MDEQNNNTGSKPQEGLNNKITQKYGLSTTNKVIMAIMFILIVALTIYVIAENQKEVPVTQCTGNELNNSFNTGYSAGYNEGIGYAVNETAKMILTYSQNCSIVKMNYSNNIFGFVDVTCIAKPDELIKLQKLVVG